MISCAEFILAYNEMFNFLEEHYGKEAVVGLLEYISDKFLTNLRQLVEKEGIQGMNKYWSRTLTEESAKYEMFVGNDYLVIDMHECPSVGALRKAKHIIRYPDYCKHCDTLYRRIIEKFGFDYKITYTNEEKGECRVEIRKK